MAYLLTNASALTALEALTATQKALNSTQTEISTGMSVSQASDNPAYWSIATEMNSNNGVLSAVQSALSQSSAMIDVATAAVNTVISTINSIKTDLANAENPGSDINQVQTSVTQLGLELKQAVAGASYNGTNLLDGSTAATLNFISGYQQSAAGVPTVDTIVLNTSPLYTAAGTTSNTVAEADITSATAVASITGLTDNTGTVTTASYGNDKVDVGTTNPNAVTVTTVDLNGVTTATTYTALDATNNQVAVASANHFSVSVTTTYPGGSGSLHQNNTDVTNITVATGTLNQTIIDVDAALTAITTYASQLGSAQSQMKSQSTFVSSLADALTNGVAALIDADMNQASTRLQALQTQQQLGVQSLSIANQQSQLILKLFG